MKAIIAILIIIVIALALTLSFARSSNDLDRPFLVENLIELEAAAISDGEIKYSISINNPTPKSIKILGVKTTCSCTAAIDDVEDNVLPPNSITSFVIKADIKSKSEGATVFNSLIMLENYAPMIHQATVTLKKD